MSNIIYQLLLTITFCLTSILAIADENFELTHIASPFKLDKTDYPLLEMGSLGTDEDGVELEHLNVITIRGNKLVYNGESCNYEIERIVPFSLSRAFVSIIKDSGGESKFKHFLKNKLHTDFGQLKSRYWLKVSNEGLDNKACQLLQSQFIFRSPNELVLSDTTYFYRFKLNNEFKW